MASRTVLLSIAMVDVFVEKLLREVRVSVGRWGSREVESNKNNALPLSYPFFFAGRLLSPEDCCFAQPLHTPSLLW
jgi:hypothetical protein